MVNHVTRGLSLLRGRRLRITRLDACGKPIYGASSQVVTKGFISVNFTAQTTETDEINVTNASGESCIYEASVQSFAGYAIEVQFCRVDPELLTIMTGQNIVVGADGATTIGFDVDTKVNLANVNWAMELYVGTKTAGLACGETGGVKIGYALMPWLTNGYLSDFTVENNAVTFTVTGARTKDGNQWGVGPYSDIMYNSGGTATTAMNNPVSSTTALRLIEVDNDVPAVAEGARPLLNPTATPLTSIAFTKGANAQTANFTTTPAATTPVYWDFGDGTWDYVAAPGATNHVYPTGTASYTARAQQNGVWRSTTVNVPIP